MTGSQCVPILDTTLPRPLVLASTPCVTLSVPSLLDIPAGDDDIDAGRLSSFFTSNSDALRAAGEALPVCVQGICSSDQSMCALSQVPYSPNSQPVSQDHERPVSSMIRCMTEDVPMVPGAPHIATRDDGRGDQYESPPDDSALASVPVVYLARDMPTPKQTGAAGSAASAPYVLPMDVSTGHVAVCMGSRSEAPAPAPATGGDTALAGADSVYVGQAVSAAERSLQDKVLSHTSVLSECHSLLSAHPFDGGKGGCADTRSVWLVADRLSALCRETGHMVSSLPPPDPSSSTPSLDLGPMREGVAQLLTSLCTFPVTCADEHLVSAADADAETGGGQVGASRFASLSSALCCLLYGLHVHQTLGTPEASAPSDHPGSAHVSVHTVLDAVAGCLSALTSASLGQATPLRAKGRSKAKARPNAPPSLPSAVVDCLPAVVSALAYCVTRPPLSSAHTDQAPSYMAGHAHVAPRIVSSLLRLAALPNVPLPSLVPVLYTLMRRCKEGLDSVHQELVYAMTSSPTPLPPTLASLTDCVIGGVSVARPIASVLACYAGHISSLCSPSSDSESPSAPSPSAPSAKHALGRVCRGVIDWLSGKKAGEKQYFVRLYSSLCDLLVVRPSSTPHAVPLAFDLALDFALASQQSGAAGAGDARVDARVAVFGLDMLSTLAAALGSGDELWRERAGAQSVPDTEASELLDTVYDTLAVGGDTAGDGAGLARIVAQAGSVVSHVSRGEGEVKAETQDMRSGGASQRCVVLEDSESEDQASAVPLSQRSLQVLRLTTLCHLWARCHVSLGHASQSHPDTDTDTDCLSPHALASSVLGASCSSASDVFLAASTLRVLSTSESLSVPILEEQQSQAPQLSDRVCAALCVVCVDPVRAKSAAVAAASVTSEEEAERPSVRRGLVLRRGCSGTSLARLISALTTHSSTSMVRARAFRCLAVPIDGSADRGEGDQGGYTPTLAGVLPPPLLLPMVRDGLADEQASVREAALTLLAAEFSHIQGGMEGVSAEAADPLHSLVPYLCRVLGDDSSSVRKSALRVILRTALPAIRDGVSLSLLQDAAAFARTGATFDPLVAAILGVAADPTDHSVSGQGKHFLRSLFVCQIPQPPGPDPHGAAALARQREREAALVLLACLTPDTLGQVVHLLCKANTARPKAEGDTAPTSGPCLTKADRSDIVTQAETRASLVCTVRAWARLGQGLRVGVANAAAEREAKHQDSGVQRVSEDVLVSSTLAVSQAWPVCSLYMVQAASHRLTHCDGTKDQAVHQDPALALLAIASTHSTLHFPTALGDLVGDGPSAVIPTTLRHLSFDDIFDMSLGVLLDSLSACERHAASIIVCGRSNILRNTMSACQFLAARATSHLTHAVTGPGAPRACDVPPHSSSHVLMSILCMGLPKVTQYLAGQSPALPSRALTVVSCIMSCADPASHPFMESLTLDPSTVEAPPSQAPPAVEGSPPALKRTSRAAVVKAHPLAGRKEFVREGLTFCHARLVRAGGMDQAMVYVLKSVLLVLSASPSSLVLDPAIAKLVLHFISSPMSPVSAGVIDAVAQIVSRESNATGLVSHSTDAHDANSGASGAEAHTPTERERERDTAETDGFAFSESSKRVTSLKRVVSVFLTPIVRRVCPGHDRVRDMAAKHPAPHPMPQGVSPRLALAGIRFIAQVCDAGLGLPPRLFPPLLALVMSPPVVPVRPGTPETLPQRQAEAHAARVSVSEAALEPLTNLLARFRRYVTGTVTAGVYMGCASAALAQGPKTQTPQAPFLAGSGAVVRALTHSPKAGQQNTFSASIGALLVRTIGALHVVSSAIEGGQEQGSRVLFSFPRLPLPLPVLVPHLVPLVLSSSWASLSGVTAMCREIDSVLESQTPLVVNLIDSAEQGVCEDVVPIPTPIEGEGEDGTAPPPPPPPAPPSLSDEEVARRTDVLYVRAAVAVAPLLVLSRLRADVLTVYGVSTARMTSLLQASRTERVKAVAVSVALPPPQYDTLVSECLTDIGVLMHRLGRVLAEGDPQVARDIIDMFHSDTDLGAQLPDGQDDADPSSTRPQPKPRAPRAKPKPKPKPKAKRPAKRRRVVDDSESDGEEWVPEAKR
ncbi:hypothetical protein KIPB_003973 [Kipferlia bialata]|uniref:Uncharacterized protein n=1 Tax=Kipferlia bialata TaxID=797122 RepID=A0A9K3CUA1_9EUKA|nr:hypothetical protein KIPB_003973 [Kipferlia bialata]|eukprot:g3973.t1